ncbi:MAG: FtsX-like permease family protein [Bacteroidetes bacterium]|nr:FtsX-like permease family protein [Bacteroidota bacterium]
MFFKRSDDFTKRGLRTNYVSTIFGISLVLFMIGIVFGSIILLRDVEKQFKENLQGDVFFLPNFNDADIKQIEQEMKSWEELKEVFFVSPERAMDELFDESELSDQTVLDIDSTFLIPSSIGFKPRAEYTTLEGMKHIENKIMKLYPKQVESVNYDKKSIESLDRGFNQFTFVFMLITALLILIAVAMINNTIRLSIYSKRFTIKTMQLVGATGRFIRKPFIIQAIIQGLVSSLIGLSLTMTIFYALDNTIDTVDLTYSVSSFLLLALGVFTFGLILTIISTWFALNNYLRKKLDDLY